MMGLLLVVIVGILGSWVRGDSNATEQALETLREDNSTFPVDPIILLAINGTSLENQSFVAVIPDSLAARGDFNEVDGDVREMDSVLLVAIQEANDTDTGQEEDDMEMDFIRRRRSMGGEGDLTRVKRHHKKKCGMLCKMMQMRSGCNGGCGQPPPPSPCGSPSCGQPSKVIYVSIPVYSAPSHPPPPPRPPPRPTCDPCAAQHRPPPPPPPPQPQQYCNTCMQQPSYGGGSGSWSQSSSQSSSSSVAWGGKR